MFLVIVKTARLRKRKMYEKILTKQKKVGLQSIADDIRARKDPTFFPYTGTQVYCGKQGSGKTVSAVYHVSNIKRKYPQAILVSNLELTNYKHQRDTITSGDQLRSLVERINPEQQYIFFQTVEELHLVLTGVNNGFLGVIYLIDEIHTYFNALNSKNTPMHVFTEISQQRKQRKLIIGTSQLFLRLEKAFREQCNNLIMCRTFLNFWTFQKAYDGMELRQEYDGTLIGHAKRTGWFFHNREIRNSYDTYQKVVSAELQYEQSSNFTISEPKKRLSIRKR